MNSEGSLRRENIMGCEFDPFCGLFNLSLFKKKRLIEAQKNYVEGGARGSE